MTPSRPLRVLVVTGWLRAQREDGTAGRLAAALEERGHAVALADWLDLGVAPDGRVEARTHAGAIIPNPTRPSPAAPGVFRALLAGRTTARTEAVDDFDAVVLRANPADRYATWTERIPSPLAPFGRLLQRVGVPLVNDPAGAERAAHPSFMLDVPVPLRPRMAITRDLEQARAFLRELGAPAVIKPAAGYGGDGVLFVDGPDAPNLPSMFGLLARAGWVVVQERIDAALTDGDKRVLLWRGEPFEVAPGQPSVYRRRRAPGDLRNNLSAGGRREPCDLDAADRAVIAALGPALAANGVLLAGLDLAGGRLLEINAHCPGGLESLAIVYGRDPSDRVAAGIEDLARARQRPA